MHQILSPSGREYIFSIGSGAASGDIFSISLASHGSGGPCPFTIVTEIAGTAIPAVEMKPVCTNQW